MKRSNSAWKDGADIGRDQQLGDGHADRFRARPAEDGSACGFHSRINAVLIPLDERIERCVDDATRHAFAFDQRLLDFAPLGEIARNFGVADDLTVIVAHRVDHHIRPETLAAFADAPALGLVASVAPRCLEHACRHAGGAVFGRIEDREMLADDLIAAVTLDAFGAGVPIGHEAVLVEHENRVIDDAADEEAKAALALAQPLISLGHLLGTFFDTLLEHVVKLTQRSLGRLPLGNIDQHVDRADQPSIGIV